MSVGENGDDGVVGLCVGDGCDGGDVDGDGGGSMAGGVGGVVVVVIIMVTSVGLAV